MIWRKQDKSIAQQRLERLSIDEILNWSDNAGSGVARGLGDYRSLRLKSPEDAQIALAEARQGLEILLDAVSVLEARA